jgi:hypothetical protein
MARSRHLAAVWSLSVAAAIAAGGAGSDRAPDRDQVSRAPARAEKRPSVGLPTDGSVLSNKPTDGSVPSGKPTGEAVLT